MGEGSFGTSRRLALLLLGAAVVPAVLPAAAQELPTGGQVVAGDVAIAEGPGRMEVTQGSAYGIVDWQGFGIGSGGAVRFANGTGATLNRVTGPGASAILGRLEATGSVYVLNPNGVVIGETGVVDTGGRFVASTLDVTNEDFLNGGDLTFAGSGGVVLNLGKVGSSGGDVALIAGDVVNRGSLTAPEGTVALAAGRKVMLRDAAVDDGLISVITGGGDVTDEGAIAAAAAELRAKGGNVYALAGNTDGVIQATGVKKVGGRVFLTAEGGKVKADKAVKAADSVTITGQAIDLSALVSAPEVVVKAEDELTYSGMIDTGPDGFVELSGAHLTYDGAVDAGGGRILVDPRNIEITDANSAFLSNATLFTTAEIEGLLATGDLILDTSTPDTGDAGTIAVTSTLSWTGVHGLTMLAMGDIWVLADVQNHGSGDVTAVAGWDGATAFDAATFDAADLATTTLFGQASGASYDLGRATETATGTVHIGAATSNFGAAFGSKTGATRAYGRDIDVMAGVSAAVSSTNPYAQLGYHTTGGGDFGTVGGDITARAVRDVQVTAGSGVSAYALIGHGGNELGGDVATPTATLASAITVEAGRDLALVGGAGSAFEGSYAMIGHGSRDYGGFMTDGNRRGAIRLTLGGELSLQEGANFTNAAWIGHQTGLGTISNAPVTVTAAAMDLDATTSVGAGQSRLNLPMWADLTHSGDVRVTVTGSDLFLTGTTEFIDTEGLSITSDFDFILQDQGQLTLDSSFFYGNNGTGALVLAGESVINPAGSGAFLAIGGGWSIYSTRPDLDLGLIGEVPLDGLVYGVAYDPADPRGPNKALGNVLHYSAVPEVTTDDVTMTFGDTYVHPVSHLVLGGVEVDPASFGITLTTGLDTTGIPINGDGNMAAGAWSDALYALVTPTASAQVLGLAATRGSLSIAQRLVTLTLADLSTTYDGSAPYVPVPTWSGFAGSDSAALISGLVVAYAGGDGSGINAGTYTVSGSGAVESSGNYVLDMADTAALSIARAALSVTITGLVTKTYDGSDLATLGALDYTITGFATGEGGRILQTSGLYDSADAGGREVTASLGDPVLWSFDAGTLVGNYDLPSFATGSGRIDPRQLTVSIVGTPRKPYDGQTAVTLGASNYEVAGLVGSDAVTIGQTSGTFASPAPGVGTISADLTLADYAAAGETNLGNYTIDTLATGPGVIATNRRATPNETGSEPVTTTSEVVDPEPPSLNGTLEVIDTETTGQILEQVQAGTAFCREFVDPEYAIDCLSDRLQSVADGLSTTGEYSEVRAALEDAAAQLHALAVQNATAALSRSVARADDGSGRTSGRPLTAIDPARLEDANAQAAAIIANTQLVLLRSTGNSERRRVAFSQVGQVLGATTVLLRS